MKTNTSSLLRIRRCVIMFFLLPLLFTANLGAQVIISETVVGGGSTIGIYINGNWINNGTFTSGLCTVVFNGSSEQTIGGGSTTTYYGLTINNTSTGVILNTAITVNGTLTLTGGIFTTTSTDILTLGSSASVSGGSASSFVSGPMDHIWTSGDKTFPIGKGTAYRPVTVASIAGSSPVIRFEMFNANPGGTAGSGLVKISSVRYWYGSITSGSITAATVNLTYEDDDGVEDAADLRVARSATKTGTYDNLGGTGSGTPSGNITSNDVSSTLNYFTLGSSTGDNSLPVELSFFEVSVLPFETAVELRWRTESEIENAFWEIQRKQKEQFKIFKKFVGQGSKSSETNYHFVDKNVNAGQTYTYRLVDVSINGFKKSHLPKTITVSMPYKFELYQNYPNPFNPLTIISYSIPSPDFITLKVYDMLGKEIRTVISDFQKPGTYSINFDASGLSSGIYLYRLQVGNDFVEIKKMLLMH